MKARSRHFTTTDYRESHSIARMQRSFVSLARFEPRCLGLDGFKQCFRRSFSQSTGLQKTPVLWTREELLKILELHQNGLSAPEITRKLNNRSHASVAQQLYALRLGRLDPSSKEHWTAEEDSILIAKRQAGCRFKDIHLPGRSPWALTQRWKDAILPRTVEASNASNPRRKWSNRDFERMIDLRINKRKSMKEIAATMGTSRSNLNNVWRRHCKHLVPKGLLQELRSSRDWTAEEDDILVKLYNEGKKMPEIHAHFPQKTLGATRQRLYEGRNAMVLRQPRMSPGLMESMKQELEPYIRARFTKAALKRVHERYPMSSEVAITSTVRRMRTGKAVPTRLKIDRVVAEDRISSRRSSRAR